MWSPRGKGGKTFEADYYVPGFCHAAMEPPGRPRRIQGRKVTDVGSDAKTAAVQDIVAKELGHPEGHVICHVTLPAAPRQ